MSNLGAKGGLMPNLLETAGRGTLDHLDYVGSLNVQLWATLRGMDTALPLVGNRHRWRAAVHQMLEIGVEALPMIALLAICSGFILAMQGASELRRFGALHYVIDLVAVGFTRELGPLLTAIAVSGRSGSAFAAEIGTMKVTEEIDALKVMAFEPVEFVLAPKYLAALVAVPCLSIVSNLFGILAGGLSAVGQGSTGGLQGSGQPGARSESLRGCDTAVPGSRSTLRAQGQARGMSHHEGLNNKSSLASISSSPYRRFLIPGCLSKWSRG